MKRIRQHGPDEELFDMTNFIPVVVEHHPVTHWIAVIRWALAHSGEKSESASIENERYSTKGLMTLYEDIYQTIDGTLTAFNGEEALVRLEAVDSSYWEITSDNEAFLDAMEKSFGMYE